VVAGAAAARPVQVLGRRAAGAALEQQGDRVALVVSQAAKFGLLPASASISAPSVVGLETSGS
jgi:hypothetical protein